MLARVCSFQLINIMRDPRNQRHPCRQCRASQQALAQSFLLATFRLVLLILIRGNVRARVPSRLNQSTSRV